MKNTKVINNAFNVLIMKFYQKKNKQTNNNLRLIKLKSNKKIIFIIIKLILLFIFLFISEIHFFNTNIKNKKIYYSYINYKIYKRIRKKKLLKNINFGIYIFSLNNGGRERITALLINYLYREKIFNIYLLTNTEKSPYEYKIPDDIKRIKIFGVDDLKYKLIKNNIDVFVYQSYDIKEMKMLNSLNNTKTIFYNHSTFLIWIYFNQIFFLKNLYNEYKKSKFVISLIPFENDYLFKKWDINSILMNNFITYNYEDIIPSNLSSKTIIMVGRANDHLKRFDLGIQAMKYIVKEVPDCEMKIISNLDGVDYLINLVESLGLKNNVKFVGYILNPEIFYKNASLHIFPSIIECFPMVLSETKIYGIPNIIAGIDYISTAKGGVININNDDPESIAKESIKILKNINYRKDLGKIARKSMKKYKNEITLRKWIELILSVYYGEYFYIKLKKNQKQITKKEAIIQLENQLNLMKIRMRKMQNITISNILNMNFF